SGSQPEAACKHLWATILAADEAELIGGSGKPGYFPPFTSEEPASLGMEDWDDDLPGDLDVFEKVSRRTGAANGKSTGRAAAPVQPRLRPWESQLKSLRQEMDHSEPVMSAAGRDREILFEIDVEQSRVVKQLVVQTSQRQRRANGQW